MILFRRNSFSETSTEVPFIQDEKIYDLVKRTIKINGYDDSEEIMNHFQVLINGHKIDKEFWQIIVLKESDDILIGPIISRGEGAQIFKTVALIALTVAIATFNPYTAGTFAYAAFAVGATIAGTLAINALIPPPELPGLGGLGGLSSEESQMYSITNQSNQAKKFGVVPKVYGTHKMFPLIAANPYTELKPDTTNDRELVQYFNCVYDFGLGPVDVRNIKIGDTLISEYSDVNYALVDFNVPSTPNTVWDEVLENKLQFYKGDIEREDVSYALNQNQYIEYPNVINIDEEEFRVVRNVPLNTTTGRQEVVLDFVCPQGLIGYDSAGKTYDRSIELKVEFSNATGPEVWRAFNDLSYVTTFKTLGGIKNSYRDVETKLPLREETSSVFYDQLQSTPSIWDNAIYEPTQKLYYRQIKYGFKKGRTAIRVQGTSIFTTPWQVGDNVFYRGVKIGKVASRSLYGPPVPPSGYITINLETGISNSIEVFTKTLWYDGPGISGTLVKTTYSASNGSEAFNLIKKQQSFGSIIITDKIPSQKFFSIRFTPSAIANYKVRVTRVRTTGAADFNKREDLSFISILSRTNKNPINTQKRHAFLDLQILATNQINGSVQNLSAEVTSILPVYNPSTQTWTEQATNNPAWIFVDLLTGPVNPKPISKSRLHLESIVEWADFCDEIPPNTPTKVYFDKRFTCNFVLDFNTTLQQIINKICNSAQASLNIIDGKYGVLIDKNKTIPVQIFTPRNSWDFSSSRAYFDPPHALKIRYVAPEKNWGLEEVIVYNEGYTASNATEFDELSTFACTSFEQAYRFGRYMLVQAILRQETINITVDFEHIVCTKGDYVQISQDVMKVGGSPARVKSVVGTVITIDDGIETTAVPYGYTFRSVGGIETNTLTVLTSTEFDLDGPLPSVGDLIVIGPVGNITFDCLVKSITPNNDLTANIVLVEKADAIYDYESTTDFPDYSPQININQNSEEAAPPAVEELEVVENTWRVIGSSYQYYIDLDWEVTFGVAYELFEIYVDTGVGYNLVGFTKESVYEYIVNPDYLGVEHSFKVLAVSANGKKISIFDAPSVEATPERKVTPPSDIEGLFINITNQVIQLEWTRVFDSDLKEYLIRYSPDIESAIWETSIPLAKISGITNTASFQGRTGSYFVKAIDLNNNQSTNAAKAITSIPKLFDLNAIEETNDFPALPGEKIATELLYDSLFLKKVNNGSLTASEYYPEGYYYYSNLLNMGEIYTVRLQSLVRAEGFSELDLMSNWATLAEVESLFNAGEASWDVETEYRGTNQLNVMENWPTLSSIDPLSEGVQDQWTPWKKFTIGDFTFRIAQFRLKLISYVPSVSPRVFDGVIKADMPDRFESYNNLISGLTPSSISYDPAFAGPGTTPNIQITIDDAETGDYFTITNKTLNGFDIIFYDLNDNPVIRQFDIAVKGYGRKALEVI